LFAITIVFAFVMPTQEASQRVAVSNFFKTSCCYILFHRLFSIFFLDTKGGAKKGRQMRTRRVFCLAHTQLHAASFVEGHAAVVVFQVAKARTAKQMPA